ncbi:MAG: heavy metal translocating P-type ATPase, partial [Caldilineaceae bacterium]|nr:heavy metal translocating P-type ATPase [Caldilineaceae bacterium]
MNILNGGDAVETSADQRRLNREVLFTGASLAVTIGGALFYPPLRLLSLPGVLYSLIPIYRDAYQSARAGQIDVNVLYAATQSLIVGRGYLLPANLGAFYYFLSRKLLMMAENRVEVQLHEIFGQLPSTVHKLVDGAEVNCTLEQIVAGDLIAVWAGETIPVDGVVASGVATVDQQRLTGEAQPTEKGEGETVYASTTVLDGTLYIQVTQAGAATAVAQIGALLAQARDAAADRQLWGKRLGDRLVLPLVTLGGLSIPLVGWDGAQAIIDSHPQRRMNISMALCALNHLGVAADAGILVKDGRALEVLQQVDTILFDKTGTLTLSAPSVAQIYPAPGMRAEDVLRYAAAAEARQEHPIARALLDAAQAAHLTLPPIDASAYYVGQGLTVRMGEQQIRVGSQSFIMLEGIPIPAESQQQLTLIWEQGDTGILVAVDEQVIGLIELRATLRPEAAAVVQMVQQRGMHCYVLSGDHVGPTRRLAERLGIAHYVAGALPEEKASAVTRLQAQGRTVCFIGDGINDAIAMQQADVAISLRDATSAATDTAHIVLMQADLQQLAALLTLTGRYTRNRQATAGIFLAGSSIAIGGACLAGFGLWQVAMLNMITFPLSVGVAMWPQWRKLMS